MHRAAVAAAVFVLLAVAGCGGSSTPGRHAAAGQETLHGAIPSDHTRVPSFALRDTAGRRFALPRDVQGKVTLLYFGYTHCPDQCPTAMADLAQALRRTTPQVARDVAVVFVTTDPWRDSRPVLKQWLDRFSPSFVGLTGTPPEIAGAQVQVGMPISRRVPGKGAERGRYSVDHFAAVFAYGRDGRLATLYPSGVTPADIAADLPVLDKG